MLSAEEVIGPYDGLKKLLEIKNLHQSFVAKEIGMDRTTFNLKINRSNGRDFSMSEAFKISKVVGEDIENFF